MFSSILTTIRKRRFKVEQAPVLIAMPASTKIITASEIKAKSKEFTMRLSLFDTGTDAYLR